MLRVQFSDLNAHKFRHNFECIRPLCNCGMAIEDIAHYLLHCPRFNQLRRDLFDTVTEVLGFDIVNLNSGTLCNLLLYGSSNLTLVDRRIIIEATINYIKKTNRLSWFLAVGMLPRWEGKVSFTFHLGGGLIDVNQSNFKK